MDENCFGDEPATRETCETHTELTTPRPNSWPRAARPLACVAVVIAVFGVWWAKPGGRNIARAADTPAAITVDYPLNRSIFPPDMQAPTFQWRDTAPAAKRWEINVAFADGTPALHVLSQGEGLKIGEIDQRCISANNHLPELTPEQAAAHTWKPDAATWQAIRRHAVEHAATITVAGYGEGSAREPLSRGSM